MLGGDGIGAVALAGREMRELLERPAALLRALLGLVGVELDLPSILDALAPRGIGAFDFGAEATLQATIPAANGLFTARSLAQMYAALASGGALDGVRLLSPDDARAGHRGAAGAGTPRSSPSTCAGGSATTASSRRVGVPRHAFGHFGFGGSGRGPIPTRELAVGADRQQRDGHAVRRPAHRCASAARRSAARTRGAGRQSHCRRPSPPPLCWTSRRPSQVGSAITDRVIG